MPTNGDLASPPPLNRVHVIGNVRASVHDSAAATLKNFPALKSDRIEQSSDKDIFFEIPHKFRRSLMATILLYR